MSYHGMKVLVVGAGLSGVDACRFFLKQGAQVILTDSKPRERLSREALALERQGVTLRLGNILPER